MKTQLRPPKFIRAGKWLGYANPLWNRKKKKDVTILYNTIERRKSYFLRAYFERFGFKYKDLGDHIKDDVSLGKEYGNRMECSPMYFTSGALLRALFALEKEGLSKEEIVERYVFLGGGGQCGPCRYGMYPQEYLKVVNEAGFKDFRVLLFTSDLAGEKLPRDSAFRVDLFFLLNFLVALMLADLLHAAECALRPYAVDKEEVDDALEWAEKVLLEAFSKRNHLVHVVAALRRVGRRFASIELQRRRIPLIFVTGEFFANLSHSDANYHLRRFIMDEGCEPLPGLFVQRALYDNWRRTVEARAGIRYAESLKERAFWYSRLSRQTFSTKMMHLYWNSFVAAFQPEKFGAHTELLDFEHLADIGGEFYNPEIFGGEGHLEVAEAIHYADHVDGFISCKPFGCMPSSGVSDGVQAKIMSLYPNLDFLSIETSGDNEVSILSRVSMLLFKAKQRVQQRKATPRKLLTKTKNRSHIPMMPPRRKKKPREPFRNTCPSEGKIRPHRPAW